MSESNLNDLLSAGRSDEDFKKLYLCEWKQDPIMQECVAFMRYATPEEIRVYKREGLITGEQVREATRIIESEGR